MRLRFAGFLLSLLLFPALASFSQAPAFHAHTDWQLKPSLKYDTLCLLNTLSGDPFYLHFYQSEYDHFHPLFTPAENDAFVQLKHILKDQGAGIVSATLSLYYSTVPDETLPEMIQTARDPSRMEAALRQTTYWDPDGWKRFDAARPALITALSALVRIGLPAYWAQTAEPRSLKRIAELTPELASDDIVPDVERHLGFPLPSGTITVFLLNYSEPHGIRITGLRFLTHVRYPFRIVLHNAIHETMHPPYHIADPAVAKAVATLAADPLIADKVQHHNPSFGYNTAPGYIEEDSVQALEQLISADFNIAQNTCQYWQKQDDGIHVLAAAIYTGYKAAYAQHPIPYTDWFVHAVSSGQLTGDNLKSTVDAFFHAPDCTAAPPPPNSKAAGLPPRPRILL